MLGTNNKKVTEILSWEKQFFAFLGLFRLHLLCQTRLFLVFLFSGINGLSKR